MLQDKDIKKISELKNGFTPRWFDPDFILSSLKGFLFSAACKSLNPLKLRGYSFEYIISILICLPFIGFKTVNSLIGSFLASYIDVHKDAFYRLKNNAGICLRMILWLFASKFKRLAVDYGKVDSNAVRCLVFDDSFLPKTGKYIEKISRVWDHVSNSCILGYKLMATGYWDGISFIPLDFSLRREKGKNADKPFIL